MAGFFDSFFKANPITAVAANAGKLNKFAFGSGPKALVPQDLQGLRQRNIDLLTSFLKPGAFKNGGAGSEFFGLPSTDAVSPETATFERLRPILEGMLTGTGPQFERDIAMGNQQGGRFGSANAIMRGEAFRNLFNMRGQTAQTLGALSQGAGGSQRDAAHERLQLLLGLFGMGAQPTLGAPVENDRGAFGDILKTLAVTFGGGK